MSKRIQLQRMKAGQMRSRAMSVFGLALLASGAFALPQYAHAASSYGTLTQLIKDLVTWLFIDGGPYIFMATLGIICIMVGKGWIHIKSGVITVVVCFLFFCVPAAVVYLKQQAATAINNG
ncbi:mating pair formation protein [Burkholderia vietnamiensis]|uniref:Mating pair formation protein n=1 Tax=Burkholderia vietnamiensis TaxID=60552 RepID=A0AA44XXJ8_BURVI|nr:mating pair formation protein [Burkholderia vietnamiensis]PRH40431.1 mating pair formation protein [Burkholderia vietnamiensis]